MKPCGKFNWFIGFTRRILLHKLLLKHGLCLIKVLDVKKKYKHLLIDPSFQGGNVGHLHRLLSIESSSQVLYYFFWYMKFTKSVSLKTFGANFLILPLLIIQILYVGDHIYGDILRSKKVLGKIYLSCSFKWDCLLEVCLCFFLFLILTIIYHKMLGWRTMLVIPELAEEVMLQFDSKVTRKVMN